MRLLFSNEIDTIILDTYGNPAGYILPIGKSKLIENHEAQSRMTVDKAAAVARTICAAAINNKISLLRSIRKNTDIDIIRYSDNYMH